jgi:hypothetical protein
MNDAPTREDDADWTTVFLSVPTPADEASAKEASELAVDAVRRACQHAGRDAGDPWHVKVTEGRLAPTDDPAQIRRAIRRKLVGEIDALIALLRGASLGCGREIGWAAEFGIPTLLLHRRDTPLSAHAGGTPPEAGIELREYDSPAELHDTVRGWMTEHKPLIVAGQMRRTRPLTVTEPLRRAAVEALAEAGPGERRRVRDALVVSESQLNALLANAMDFAEARTGLTFDLLCQLGVVLPQRMLGPDWHRRTEVPLLPDDARKGLDEAIDTWGWDGSTTLRVTELGLKKLRHDRELTSAGQHQRASDLANRFAWKRLPGRRRCIALKQAFSPTSSPANSSLTTGSAANPRSTPA